MKRTMAGSHQESSSLVISLFRFGNSVSASHGGILKSFPARVSL